MYVGSIQCDDLYIRFSYFIEPGQISYDLNIFHLPLKEKQIIHDITYLKYYIVQKPST